MFYDEFVIYKKFPNYFFPSFLFVDPGFHSFGSSGFVCYSSYDVYPYHLLHGTEYTLICIWSLVVLAGGSVSDNQLITGLFLAKLAKPTRLHSRVGPILGV